MMIDDTKFWRRVRVGDGCWEWQGSLNNKGYGTLSRIAVGTSPVYAHRYAIGYHDDGVVMHTCDNPKCVRPSHLTVGTQADNMKDMQRKGRGRNDVGLALLEVLREEVTTITECPLLLAKRKT